MSKKKNKQEPEVAIVDGRPRHYLRLTTFKQVVVDEDDMRAIAARRASVAGARKGGMARAKKRLADVAERDKEIAREHLAGKSLGAIARRRRLPKSTVADAAKRGLALIVVK
jgi:DNA-binding NarL/FixJ family response regulator